MDTKPILPDTSGHERPMEGITFGDVLLRPRYSEVRSRATVSLKSRLIGDIHLELPIVSSNMDTVTEDQMAVAMALNGGVGILHRYLTIDQQVEMVRKVKRYTNFVILNPHTVSPETTFAELIETVIPSKNVSCFPVVDPNGKLLGILTKHQYQLIELSAETRTKPVSEFMIKRPDLVTGSASITKAEAISKMHSEGVNKLLIVDKDDKLSGLITSKDVLLHRASKYATLDRSGNLVVGAAVGVKREDYLERTRRLVEAGVDFVVIDVAHGHHILVKEVIEDLKKHFPSLLIMAGNVCTAEGTEFLIKAGADCIKVGVGNGSICSTRMKTGCGVPQLTAVMDTVKVGLKYNIPIIADGGHSGSIGNIFKALSLGGASACMLGRFLAGTTESPGDVIMRDGKKVKIIRGMASYTANMGRQKGGRMNIEGIEGIVPFKGEVKDVLAEIEDGLKSGMSYLGVETIPKLRGIKVEYSLLSESAKKESGYHDIKVL